MIKFICQITLVFFIIGSGIYSASSETRSSGHPVIVQQDTVNVKLKVYGTVQCKSTIEGLFAINTSVLKVKWDDKSQEMKVKFLTDQIDIDKIARLIAGAGFDNEFYLAPDDAYEQLSSECKYTRPGDTIESSFERDEDSKFKIEGNHSETKPKTVKKLKEDKDDGA